MNKSHLKESNSHIYITFQDGLDDFRDGLPPAVEGSDFLKVCD